MGDDGGERVEVDAAFSGSGGGGVWVFDGDRSSRSTPRGLDCGRFKEYRAGVDTRGVDWSSSKFSGIASLKLGCCDSDRSRDRVECREGVEPVDEERFAWPRKYKR